MKGITKILIIEDNDDDFEALTMAVEASQPDNEPRGRIPVLRARNGIEARTMMQDMRSSVRSAEETPRLILLDLKLPDVSGFDILTELKTDPRLREIPVIILTSSSNQGDVSVSYETGANSFVRKPMDLDGFTGMVERLRSFWLEAAELPVPR